jgi:hypothetical protein
MIELGDVPSRGVWAVRQDNNLIDTSVETWNYKHGGTYVANATASLRVVHVKGVELEEPAPLKNFGRNK